MKVGQSNIKGNIKGNNQWTMPWQAATGAEGTRPPPAPEYAAAAADIECFGRQGVVFLAGAISAWVEALRRGLERNLAAPKAYAFPCDSTAEGEPGTQRATPWHQDLSYYCVDGRQTASIYIALDHTPEEVAVRVAAGSHRWHRLFYPRVFLDGAEFNLEDPGLEALPDIDGRPGDFTILGWPMEPGDALVFDFRTLHGTADAPVTGRRRAFSTRWLGDDVRYCERPGETSPPYPDIGLEHGERMREDWFPVLWRRPA